MIYACMTIEARSLYSTLISLNGTMVCHVYALVNTASVFTKHVGYPLTEQQKITAAAAAATTTTTTTTTKTTTTTQKQKKKLNNH